MPKKIRELKKAIKKAGFISRPGKGSHTVWSHPQLEKVIVIAKPDGADAPNYLEKQVESALKKLKELEE